MKIAIHHRKGSFSDRWIAYCEEKSISFKIVDAYQNDIIQQIADCDAFMWHFNHISAKDTLFAKQLIFAIESSGKLVFPSTNMAWHFDDKVAQKYMLEAIEAPLINSQIFYTKGAAQKWIQKTNFPIVFKLRGGAGSENVKLVRSKNSAQKYINKAFGKGFSQYNASVVFKDRLRKYRLGVGSFSNVLKGFVRIFYTTEFARVKGNEKGYIYFQKFVPKNTSDTRVIIVGNRAFAVKRMVRENDFRASGSGVKKYEKNEIDERTIKIAFEIAKKMEYECVGFDFVFDEQNNPLIVEMGYGFAIQFYDPCPGYWDTELNWHKGYFIPQAWMVQDVINKLRKNN